MRKLTISPLTVLTCDYGIEIARDELLTERELEGDAPSVQHARSAVLRAVAVNDRKVGPSVRLRAAVHRPESAAIAQQRRHASRVSRGAMRTPAKLYLLAGRFQLASK